MEQLKLTEMNTSEMIEISGGARWWSKALEYARKGLEVIGFFDAVDSFQEGWQSVECE